MGRIAVQVIRYGTGVRSFELEPESTVEQAVAASGLPFDTTTPVWIDGDIVERNRVLSGGEILILNQPRRSETVSSDEEARKSVLTDYSDAWWRLKDL